MHGHYGRCGKDLGAIFWGHRDHFLLTKSGILVIIGIKSVRYAAAYQGVGARQRWQDRQLTPICRQAQCGYESIRQLAEGL